MVHLDLGGWDHHADQNPIGPGGQMFQLVRELSQGIGAFYNDMGGATGADSYVLIAYSEFGRQLVENNDKGTDHGYGGLMVAMGSGLKPDGTSYGKGGTVFADFGSLATSLDPLNGDSLDITVDYRHVVSDALVRRFNMPPTAIQTDFPGLLPRTNPTKIFT